MNSFGSEFLSATEGSVSGGNKWMDPRTGHIYYGDVLVE